MNVKRKAASNLRLCRGSSLAKLAGPPHCLLPCSVCTGGGKARSMDVNTTQPCMKGRKGHGVLRTSNLVSERQLYSMKSCIQPTGLVSGATQHSRGWSWLLSICEFCKRHFFMEKATVTNWVTEVSPFAPLQSSTLSYLSFVNTHQGSQSSIVLAHTWLSNSPWRGKACSSHIPQRLDYGGQLSQTSLHLKVIDCHLDCPQTSNELQALV